MCITSRASPVSISRPVPVRKPVSRRAWFTAAVASSAGIGARPSARSRSLSTIRFTSARTSLSTCSHKSVSPRSSAAPGAAAVASKSIFTVADWKPARFRFLIRARSAFDRIGCCSFTSCACAGLSLRMSGLCPRKVISDITSSSRIESIGGLVICAKSCLKYQ